MPSTLIAAAVYPRTLFHSILLAIRFRSQEYFQKAIETLDFACRSKLTIDPRFGGDFMAQEKAGNERPD
jgi:hypothetical protein